MAWADVPAKLAEYETIDYGGEENARRLLAAYSASILADVPELLRPDFEADLDYRLGACKNLIASRAIDPNKLAGA